jgi:hypothetical protein
MRSATVRSGRSRLRVAALGRAVLDGLRAWRRTRHHQAYAGPWPRDGRQPHVELPVRRCERSKSWSRIIAPFRALRDAPRSVMTGHVCLEAWDQPQNAPAHSPLIVATIIRQTIGFDGLLISPTISTCRRCPARFRIALRRAMLQRAATSRSTVGPDMAEMRACAGALPDISDSIASPAGPRARRERGGHRLVAPGRAELAAKRDALLALA